MTYLDTHVVVWLYRGDTSLLSKPARERVDRDDLLISPAVVLELEYLSEIHRHRPAARTVVHALEKDLGLKVCELPYPSVVEHALDEKWGRDPFDRLIVAQARVNRSVLVTKDSRIRDNYPLVVW